MEPSEIRTTLKRLGFMAVLQAGVWTLLIVASLAWNLAHHWQELNKLALNEGRTAIEKDVMYRRWNASVSPVYVRSSEQTPPNPHLEDFPERDIVTPSGVALTLMNPAYMTRLVHDLGELESGVRGHITSLKPLRPENRPDSWERQALEQFQAGAPEVSGVQSLDQGRRYLRVMRPLATERVCLKCHEDQGYQVGDIRGGISVSVPLQPMEDAFAEHLWVMGTWHGVLWLAVLAFIAWATRRGRAEMIHRFDVEARLVEEKEAQERLVKQLKATQGQLVQSEKLASLGQLAAGMAHEINNPVGYIRSNLNTLKDYLQDLGRLIDAGVALQADCPADAPALARLQALRQDLDDGYLREDALALVDECRQGAERVEKIVQDLNTFARPDREQWLEADLNRLLESTLNILGNELRQKAEVETDFADLPPLRCRPGKLNQVFVNLLLNAAQAIREHGHIRVTTRVLDVGQVLVEVADTGCGIEPEQLDHLFEPFFTTKPVGEGTGLGLSIAYGIVKDHGGDIEVRSTPGRGSRFRVLLPLVPTD